MCLHSRMKGYVTMDSYRFILDIGIILLTTKLFAMLSKRVRMPQVVGALLAGLILGPACLGFVDDSVFIQNIASLGVIVLMFEAGLATDLGELKRSGKASFVIALVGVLVPLAGGWLLGAYLPLHPNGSFWENMFLGVILTATSVSITVETLKELGKFNTRSGNAILGAAIIDDVLGVIALTVITSLSGGHVQLWVVLLKIAGFIALSAACGFVFHHLFQLWMDKASWDRKRFAVVGLAFGFLFAYVAEAIFGVADITGAYIAGLILSTTSRATFIEAKCHTLSFMLLSPVFFASIGLKVNLSAIGPAVILFTILFTVIAVFTKVLGCGLGAKLCRYSTPDSMRIGLGMITRGEVGLAIADKGLSSGVLHNVYLTPVILMVTITAIVTPLFLKIAYRDAPGETPQMELESSPLADSYQAASTLEEVSERILDELEREYHQELGPERNDHQSW